MKKIITFFIFIFLLIIPLSSSAAVFHVSTTGTKSSGASTPDDWTNANCYGTITAAISEMSGQDEVIVDDGSYIGTVNSIGRSGSGTGGAAVVIPSGIDGSYTTIRARNRFGAEINSGNDSDSGWDYYARGLYIAPGVSYVKVDGFKFVNEDLSNNLFLEIRGDHFKLTNALIRVEEDHDENNVLSITTDTASYVLIEDVAITGGYRYGFTVMGYANGTDTNQPNHIIFRRCVWRGDWSDSSEPISGFAIYGHNADASLGPHDIMYQNCIAIDQNESVPDADWKPYGPWYIFKGQTNVSLEGCITLSNDQTGSTSGAWITEDYSGGGIDVNNSVFYGFTGNGITFGGSDNDVDRCTFGGTSTYGLRCASMDGSTLTNSLFLTSTTDNTYNNAFTASYNSFESGTSVGADNIAYQNDCDYLVRVESDSNRYTGGLSSSKVGAHIVKKHGTTGTLWGETGWNTETSEDLWPFPNEDDIKSFFSASYTLPATSIPSSVDFDRGFCSTGNQLDGSTEITLTSYIWEFLGTQMPSEIYGAEPETPTTQSITGGTITGGSYTTN